MRACACHPVTSEELAFRGVKNRKVWQGFLNLALQGLLLAAVILPIYQHHIELSLPLAYAVLLAVTAVVGLLSYFAHTSSIVIHQTRYERRERERWEAAAEATEIFYAGYKGLPSECACLPWGPLQLVLAAQRQRRHARMMRVISYASPLLYGLGFLLLLSAYFFWFQQRQIEADTLVFAGAFLIFIMRLALQISRSIQHESALRLRAQSLWLEWYYSAE
jgi:phosphate starvation-inducible membrane PsiE